MVHIEQGGPKAGKATISVMVRDPDAGIILSFTHILSSPSPSPLFLFLSLYLSLVELALRASEIM